MDSLKTLLKQSISIFSFLFILLGNKQASAKTPKTEDCVPKSCGNSLNISYPFWLRDHQPSYCGFPPFVLTCENNDSKPVFQVFDLRFYVLDIFYDNHSIILTAVEFFDPCPFPNTNYTINSSSPIGISSLNKEIYFFRNCSNEIDLSRKYKKIGCASGVRAPEYFGGLYGGSGTLNQVDLAKAGCHLYVVPVIEYPENSSEGLAASLKRGWMSNWTELFCSDCLDSGGGCGYNETSRDFMCICPDQVQPRICRDAAKKKKNILIGALAAVGFFLLCATGFLLYRQKKKKKFSPSSKSLIQNASFMPSLKDPEMVSAHLHTHLFSYAELQKATNYFNTSNELGDGGFGTVYKGKLQDGRTVAVKRLFENNCRRLEQFMNEIEILSRLRHQNLVSLYGCTSPHSQGLLLVYEFVPNGTVADHLHGPRAAEGILTWPMRLSIAIETADALTYLHSVNPPIIHRDVKTCNILLDGSFHVKVADFGLSRLFPKDVTHVSTAPQGTPGYLDPEYHQCYQLTDKSDVYSFGVMLVELISSKPAIDMTRRRSEISLANFAVTRIQNGELEQLVDEGLGYRSDHATRKMITMVAEEAFRCLQSDGDMRPPIKEVLEVLKAIESEGHKVEDGGQGVEDEAELLKNSAELTLSPNTVMNNWPSSTSITPHTRNIRNDVRIQES
ncbi:LEAF RUST 10 DISEASE-RESISTANCE LOCUS RECEPTOR-LIKE PROTEIN KINASE-like [Canna indica]|uniref:LEAF RUST 10 DISEASE-RESISTANCE LOCUS RECEPTOR-LIKE PROTEIN KINASE-like n=1 Tax=Canna indica TaxID=4628 RepID=A0AAQ3JNP6_9LILI|nr:LEAF RUST 10 DISEASE-RESISTANCE LOCUS RECEPTOR-LIKE PROTEIN KINASE-like [Canna indica]